MSFTPSYFSGSYFTKGYFNAAGDVVEPPEVDVGGGFSYFPKRRQAPARVVVDDDDVILACIQQFIEGLDHG